MQNELTIRLRRYSRACLAERLDPDFADAVREAVEAIEKLSKAQEQWIERERKELLKSIPKWIPIESRPMDEEERQYYSEHYGYKLTDEEAVIYCSQLPEHGQEVLVCSMYGHIWKDTFDDDPDYGVGFEENGDMDGIVAWMPLPAPPEEEKNI